LCLSSLASRSRMAFFLSFSPCGTLFWLGVITAGSVWSCDRPSETASSLSRLPCDASHSILPLTLPSLRSPR
jgi:hypothetical protein